MRHGDDGALIVLQKPLEPRHRFGVEMVGRLVEQQQIGRLQQQAAQRDAAPLAARQRLDLDVRRRKPQRVHRELELRIELPRAGGVDLVLDARLLGEDLVHLLGREILCELLVDLVEPLQQRARLGDPLLDDVLHRLRRIELRLLLQEADRDAVGRERFADEVVIEARHDLQQRALA